MQSLVTKNIKETLDRLLSQLDDLESYKDELDADELAEIRADTESQIAEFEVYLKKIEAENAELAKEAQEKLDKKKEKILGMKKMQEKI